MKKPIDIIGSILVATFPLWTAAMLYIVITWRY